jgi:transposase
MNSFVFLEWFENQLMPALKNPSLVVLDNASYHNVKTEDTLCPNFSKTKAVLQNYNQARIFQSRHQLIFKPLKKDKTIHLLVIVTIL